jgi:hypothetical protein
MACVRHGLLPLWRQRNVERRMRTDTMARRTPTFEFTNGPVAEVIIDVAGDAYVDVERVMAAAMARD